jgi:hypothetical protein
MYIVICASPLVSNVCASKNSELNRGCLAEPAMFLPFRRVTAGLKGGAKRVAGIAELAAWLLLVKGAAIYQVQHNI